jgi:hypothetical protein
MKRLTRSVAFFVMAAFAAASRGAEPPANSWTALTAKVVLPAPWDKGLYVPVNAYGSITYCDHLGLMLNMDGYLLPGFIPGKSILNNYSCSLYGFDVDSRELRLIKRSNWRTGARTDDPKFTSYPLPEYKGDPTPAPGHLYRGLTYLPDTKRAYLVGLCQASNLSKHPEFDRLGAKDMQNFWSFDFDKNRWELLPPPPFKFGFESTLAAVPGTGRIYLFSVLDAARYDLAQGQWTKLGKPPTNLYACEALVDAKRKHVVFTRAVDWLPAKDKPAKYQQSQLLVFDADKETFALVDGEGTIGGPVAHGGFACVDHLDRYFLRAESGEYLFDPGTKRWSLLKIPALTTGQDGFRYSAWNYAGYDRKRKLIVLNHHLREWAILKLDASAPTSN